LAGDSTKLSTNATDVMSVEQLAAELDSVALDWKTLRNIRECVCSTPFDHFSRKVRDVFCSKVVHKLYHFMIPFLEKSEYSNSKNFIYIPP
jgi:hypothetical protein